MGNKLTHQKFSEQYLAYTQDTFNVSWASGPLVVQLLRGWMSIKDYGQEWLRSSDLGIKGWEGSVEAKWRGWGTRQWEHSGQVNWPAWKSRAWFVWDAIRPVGREGSGFPGGDAGKQEHWNQIVLNGVRAHLCLQYHSQKLAIFQSFQHTLFLYIQTIVWIYLWKYIAFEFWEEKQTL